MHKLLQHIKCSPNRPRHNEHADHVTGITWLKHKTELVADKFTSREVAEPHDPLGSSCVMGWCA